MKHITKTGSQRMIQSNWKKESIPVITKHCTKGNFSKAHRSSMDSESKFGKMDPGISDGGKRVRPREEESLFMQTETFISVSGKTTKQKDMECTLTKTEPCTKDNGFVINNMGMDLKLGLMGLSIRETMWRAKKRAEANSIGQTDLSLRVNFIKTILKEKVFTSGQMEEFTLEIGSITK